MKSKSKQLKRLWSLALLLMLMCLPEMAWAQTWSIVGERDGSCTPNSNYEISFNGLNNSCTTTHSHITRSGNTFEIPGHVLTEGKHIVHAILGFSVDIPSYTDLEVTFDYQFQLTGKGVHHGCGLNFFTSENLAKSTNAIADTYVYYGGAAGYQDGYRNNFSTSKYSNLMNYCVFAGDATVDHNITSETYTQKYTYTGKTYSSGRAETYYFLFNQSNSTGAAGSYCNAKLIISNVSITKSTYYAKVTLDGNGGTCNTPSYGSSGGNASQDLTSYSRTAYRKGYHIKGWNTKADGSGQSFTNTFTATETLRGPITLYAQWEEHAYTQDCSYGGGGLKQCSCGDVTGTYKIGSLSDLLDFNDLVSARKDVKYYPNINAELTADIEFDAATTMRPIGCEADQKYTYTKYQGTFDGKGHTIKNMRIQKATAGNQSVYLGLFYGLKGATVKNLTLTGVDFTESLASYVVGVLSPEASNCTISNVYIEGNAASNNFESKFGGMVGNAINTNFENCGTNLAIKMDGTSDRASAGGLCHHAENTTFTNCFFAGKFTDLTYDKVSQSKYRCTAPFAAYTTDVITDNCYAIEWQGSGAANNYTHNVPDMLYTKADFESGKIAYLLNGGKTDGTQAWYQTLGNEGDDVPLLTKTGSNTVFGIIEKDCDGVSILGSSFSNDNASVTVRPHNMLNFACTHCDYEETTATDGTFTDGTIYKKTKPVTIANLTYVRTFEHNDYDCLYVPFSADVTKFSDCEIYDINMFHEVDTNGDGEADAVNVEVNRMVSGNIKPNHPYIIKYKGGATGQAVSFNLGETTIVAAATEDYTCSSMNTSYTYRGCYTDIEKDSVSIYDNTLVYDTEKGSILDYPSNGIKSQRWYMNFVSLDPQISAVNQNAESRGVNRPRKTTRKPRKGESKLTVHAYSNDNALGDVKGTGSYEYGQTAELKAIPLNGHVFIKWNSGKTDQSFSITVKNNIDYKAYFDHRKTTTNGVTTCSCSGCNYVEYDMPALVNSRYEISNVGNMLWFSQNAKKYPDATFVLTADIDMQGYVYSSPFYARSLNEISYNSNIIITTGFKGVFDGQGHTISNLTVKAIKNHASAGIVGNNNGTIRNLFINNFLYDNDNGSSSDGRFGAICGVNFGTVENCAVVNSSILSTEKIVGAIAGANHGGTIKNCFVKGCTLQGNSRIGYIAGDNSNYNASLSGTITNCYADIKRLEGTLTGTACTGEHSVDDTKFKSGEICYKLNEGHTNGSIHWFQTINANPYPTLAKGQNKTVHCNNGSYYNGSPDYAITASSCNVLGSVVGGGDYAYGSNVTLTANPTQGHVFTRWTDGNTQNPRTITVSADATYTAEFDHQISSYNANGIGTCSGGCDVFIYQPATLTDGFYEIGNAGQLCSFAEKVNAGENSINGRLTADIDMTNVEYVQIGATSDLPFSGQIDGQQHAIRNLNISATTDNAASLIGFACGATIKNLTVHGTLNTSAKFAAGFIAQNNMYNSTISNCISEVAIVSTVKGDATHAGFVGVANAAVNLSNCAFRGSITSNNGSSNCAGLIGWDSTKGSTAENCYVTATFSNGICASQMIRNNGSSFATCYYLNACGTPQGNQVTAEQVKNGKLCYMLNNEVTDGSQAWYQNLSVQGDAYPVLQNTDTNTVYYGYASSTALEFSFNNVSANRGTAADNTVITDGEKYDHTAQSFVRNLGYKRTFADNGFHCLYVPFSANINVFTDCEIYTLNMFLEHDSDGDGILDEMNIEVAKATSGKILANHPYLIKYTGTQLNEPLTFTIGATTLVEANTTAFTCASMSRTYTFKGAYNEVDAATAGNYYTLTTVNNYGAKLNKNSTAIAPQQWYVTIGNAPSVARRVAGSATTEGNIPVVVSGDQHTDCQAATVAESNGLYPYTCTVCGIVPKKAIKNYNSETPLLLEYDKNTYTATENIILTDANQFGDVKVTFAAPTNATYTREMANEWGTFVVPFAITYSQNNGNYKLYQLTSVDPTTGNEKLVFTEYTDGASIAAGTPLVIRAVGTKTDGKYTVTLTAKDKSVSTGISDNAAVSGLTMKGTYSQLTNQTGKYFIAQDRFWWATKGITINPFRAWFEGTLPTPADGGQVKAFSIVIEGEDDEADAIGRIENGELKIENSSIYNINGQKLASPQKGINIVNGKKVLY